MTKRQIFGLVSAVVLLLGSFFPIVEISGILGGTKSVSYFGDNNSYGELIVLYAIAGIVLASLKQERWIIIPGGVAVLQLAYALYEYNNALSSVTDNPWAALFLQQAVNIHLSPIGWALMFAGAIGLALTPYLPFSSGLSHRVPMGKSSKDDNNFFI
jgi:hypothetical protein